MNTATKTHPGAGHGNGSVETQNQPAWSSAPSPPQTSSSTSGPAPSTTPERPRWKSSPSTGGKVATSRCRAAGCAGADEVGGALAGGVEHESKLSVRVRTEAVR